jgi:hypothetical protein
MTEYSIAIVKDDFAVATIAKDKDACAEFIRKMVNDPNVRAIMIVKIPTTVKSKL